MTTLSTKALERSTYVLTIAFKDSTGTAVVPDSITWDLTDSSGNVVNSRQTVAVAAPAASIDIVLSDDDLAIPRPGILGRIVTVEAIYDSTKGQNLPFKDEVVFQILPLVNVV